MLKCSLNHGGETDVPVRLRESTTVVQKYIQPSSTRLNLMPPLHVDDDHFGKTCPSESEEDLTMWQGKFLLISLLIVFVCVVLLKTKACLTSAMFIMVALKQLKQLTNFK